MKEIKLRKEKRVRGKLKNVLRRKRLSVFRSNKTIYAQLIDDKSGRTLFTVSDRDLSPDDKKGTKTEKAFLIGKILAEKATSARGRSSSGRKKIKEVVFDRGSFRYHGRVRRLAEGAREGGLSF